MISNKLPLKYLFSLFLGILFSFQFFAQDNYSIKDFYQEKDLDKKSYIANELWAKLHQTNVDSLRQIAIELIIVGNEEKNETAIAIGKRALGSSLIRLGDPEKGITYLRTALTYFKNHGNKLIETEILSELGNGYLNLGQPAKAENFYLQSLKEGKSSSDKSHRFMAELNLSQAYIQMKNYKKASSYLLHYKEEALKIGKLESVGSAYAMLGRIEEAKENYPLADEYYKKSYEFGKQSKSKNQIAHALNNLAIVYFRKGMADSSLVLFEEALKLREEVGNARFVSESYFNIGGLYFELKDYKKAEQFYQKCIAYSQQKKLKREEMDAVMALIELCKETKNEKELLGLFDNYIKLQELYYTNQAMENSEQNEILASIDQMDVDREREIREYKFRSLEANNRKKWSIIYLIGGLTILGIMLLVIRNTRKQAQNKVA